MSLREVDELLLERCIDVSYETIRRWVGKFGPSIAWEMRRRQPHSGDVWNLDEVVVKIKDRKFWLWRGRSKWSCPGLCCTNRLKGFTV